MNSHGCAHSLGRATYAVNGLGAGKETNGGGSCCILSISDLYSKCEETS